MQISETTRHSLKVLGGGVAIMIVTAWLVGTIFFADEFRFISRNGVIAQIFPNLIALGIGAFMGVALFLITLPKYRTYVILAGFAAIGAVMGIPGVGLAVPPILGIIALAVAFGICAAIAFANRATEPPRRDTTFGSSRWATREDLAQKDLLGKAKGIFLGRFDGEELAYTGKDANRHLLTVAPTRAGKGQCAIIPNLLRYKGSALVIDPKGENAAWTASTRANAGQAIHVVDPWNIVAGGQIARMNPLDLLNADDPDLVSDIALLADALVPEKPGEQDPYWTNQARAFVAGFILYLVLSPDEEGSRTLGRLRDILSLTFAKEDESVDSDDDGVLDTILMRMFQLDGPSAPAAASAARRILGMADKPRASVMASAHEATSWLDSPAIRENLSATDVDLNAFKTSAMTVYLVLPVDRLNAFGPWLRIHISLALQRIVRDPTKPERPVLFILDEFSAIGKLKMVEDAYAIMAGAGVQLWAIVQDFSQLQRLYKASWQTFIANAGVIQYFGSRDLSTAEYVSKMCGSMTVTNIGISIAKAFSRSFGSKSSSSESTTTSESTSKIGRPLMMADELMRVPRDQQILLIGDNFPVAAQKVYAYEDPEFNVMGNNQQKDAPPD